MNNRFSFRMIFVPLSLLFSLGVWGEDLTVPRNWVSSDGKSLLATLVSADGKAAVLKLKKDGREVSVPMNRLSEADQKAVQAWRKDFPLGVAPPQPPYRWPSRYSGSSDAKATYIEMDEETEAHVFHTKHFEIHASEKLSPTTISRCADVFESVSGALDLLPLRLQTKPSGDAERYKVILVATQSEYMKMGGIPNSAGFFSPSENVTVIPFRSLGIVKKGKNWVFDGSLRSFDTLIHELTHQCTQHWEGMPPWFQEGLSDFMEAMPYRSGSFLFTNPGSAIVSSVRDRYHLPSGYVSSNPYVKKFQKDGLDIVPLEEISTVTRREWNGNMSRAVGGMQYTTSMVLVWYFLCADGRGDGYHFIQWAHEHRNAFAKARKNDSEFNSKEIFKKHLLRNRDWKQLRADLVEASKKKGLRIID